MTKKQLGIETVNTAKGKQYTVVDYSKPVASFSKTLTYKEQREYVETGKLPDGVQKQKSFAVIDQFSSLARAKQFIKNGAKWQKEPQTGVFNSISQALHARAICKK